MEDRDEFSLDTYRIAGECTLVYQHIHYPKVWGSIPHGDSEFFFFVPRSSQDEKNIFLNVLQFLNFNAKCGINILIIDSHIKIYKVWIWSKISWSLKIWAQFQNLKLTCNGIKATKRM